MSNRYPALALFLAAALSIPFNADAQNQHAQKSKDLRISVIDVEGGASVLFVTPEGKSLARRYGLAAGNGQLAAHG